MKITKETFITAFALFSMFFGAGNLILPPLLG
ncbi:MAG: branched-chain amino acid transport system II carrier protein, partial [Leeuwenhoekiella sp.]